MNFKRLTILIISQTFLVVAGVSLLLAGSYLFFFHHWNCYPFILSSLGLALASGVVNYRKRKAEGEDIEVLTQVRSTLMGLSFGMVLILLSSFQDRVPWYVLIVPALFLGFIFGMKLGGSNKQRGSKKP